MQHERPDTPTYSPSGSEGEAADPAALDVGADGAGWSASPRWYVPATGDGYSPPYSPPSSPGTDAPISPVVPGAAAALASQSLHPSPGTGAVPLFSGLRGETYSFQPLPVARLSPGSSVDGSGLSASKFSPPKTDLEAPIRAGLHVGLTPSRPPRSNRRPKHVFYSSTAYTVHSPV